MLKQTYTSETIYHSQHSLHPRPVLYNQDHILKGQNIGQTNIQRLYNHSNASLKSAKKHYYAKIYIYKLHYTHHSQHSLHPRPVLYNQDHILKGQNIGQTNIQRIYNHSNASLKSAYRKTHALSYHKQKRQVQKRMWPYGRKQTHPPTQVMTPTSTPHVSI